MNIIEQIGDWLSEVFTGKSRRRRASRARRTGRTASSVFLTDQDLEKISRVHVPDRWPADLDAVLRPRIGPVYHPEPTQEYLDQYAGLPLPKRGKDEHYPDVIDELLSTLYEWADYYGEKAGDIAVKYTDDQQYEVLNLYRTGDSTGYYNIFYLYLLLKWYPSLSLRAAIDYTKQIVSGMKMDAFDGYDQPAWSPLEITNWYNNLDVRYKSQLEPKIRSKKARGATNEQIYEYLCEQRYQVDEWLRKEAEQIAQQKQLREQQEQEEREANKISLLEAWYIWSEQGRKHEEHEYFKRENRKARGY
jgi:hypothetical protein